MTRLLLPGPVDWETVKGICLKGESWQLWGIAPWERAQLAQEAQEHGLALFVVEDGVEIRLALGRGTPRPGGSGRPRVQR